MHTHCRTTEVSTDVMRAIATEVHQGLPVTGVQSSSPGPVSYRGTVHQGLSATGVQFTHGPSATGVQSSSPGPTSYRGTVKFTRACQPQGYSPVHKWPFLPTALLSSYFGFSILASWPHPEIRKVKSGLLTQSHRGNVIPRSTKTTTTSKQMNTL